MERHFATYLDSNYAARGLAMIDSLLRHEPEARLTVLCLDQTIRAILESEVGDSVQTLSLSQLAEFEPRLTEVRQMRTPWEFFATQKPIFIRRVLALMPEGAVLTYVDADTFFFAAPEPIFREMSDDISIAISPHRFNPVTERLKIYGTYNAGFGLWRNDAAGHHCLSEWAEECLDWCHEKPDPSGRFMNQGYLNDWPARYARLGVLAHPGVNLAPWNVGSHTISPGSTGLFVDGLPLIFFHFSNIHRTADGEWWTFDLDVALKQPLVLEEIYRPYLAIVEATSGRISNLHGISGIGSVRNASPQTKVLKLGTGV